MILPEALDTTLKPHSNIISKLTSDKPEITRSDNQSNLMKAQVTSGSLASDGGQFKKRDS